MGTEREMKWQTRVWSEWVAGKGIGFVSEKVAITVSGKRPDITTSRSALSLNRRLSIFHIWRMGVSCSKCCPPNQIYSGKSWKPAKNKSATTSNLPTYTQPYSESLRMINNRPASNATRAVFRQQHSSTQRFSIWWVMTKNASLVYCKSQTEGENDAKYKYENTNYRINDYKISLRKCSVSHKKNEHTSRHEVIAGKHPRFFGCKSRWVRVILYLCN